MFLSVWGRWLYFWFRFCRNLFWPPTLIRTLLPAWLPSTDLCNLDPFHQLIFSSLRRDTHYFLSDWSPGLTLFLPQKYPPGSPPVQIHSSRLCSDLPAPYFPTYLQPYDELPLHLFSQAHNLALKLFPHIPPNVMQAPWGQAHVFIGSLEIFKATSYGEIQRDI